MRHPLNPKIRGPKGSRHTLLFRRGNPKWPNGSKHPLTLFGSYITRVNKRGRGEGGGRDAAGVGLGEEYSIIFRFDPKRVGLCLCASVYVCVHVYFCTPLPGGKFHQDVPLMCLPLSPGEAHPTKMCPSCAPSPPPPGGKFHQDVPHMGPCPPTTGRQIPP